jgi:hypothetical protein
MYIYIHIHIYIYINLGFVWFHCGITTTNLGPPFAPIIQIRDRQSQSRWDALGPETKCGTWTPTGQPRCWWWKTQAGTETNMELDSRKGRSGRV